MALHSVFIFNKKRQNEDTKNVGITIINIGVINFSSCLHSSYSHLMPYKISSVL